MPNDNGSKEDASSSPTDALSGKLNRTQEIENKLKKLEILLDIAARCNIDVDKEARSDQPAQPDTTKTYDTANKRLMSAYKKFYTTDPNLNEIYEDLSYVNNRLTKALQKETQGLIPSKKYFSFQSMLYGLTPMIISIIAAVIFSLLLWFYGLCAISPASVPLWAALFGGLGACVQILIGLVGEIRTGGVVCEYKRIWYIILPIVALIFGYLAYVLADLGLVALGGVPGGNSTSIAASNINIINATGARTFDMLNNVSGNYSFTAHTVKNLTASGVGTFTSSAGDKARVVVCFLAGYGTDAFIKRLTNLAEKM